MGYSPRETGGTGGVIGIVTVTTDTATGVTDATGVLSGATYASAASGRLIVSDIPAIVGVYSINAVVKDASNFAFIRIHSQDATSFEIRTVGIDGSTESAIQLVITLTQLSQ